MKKEQQLWCKSSWGTEILEINTFWWTKTSWYCLHNWLLSQSVAMSFIIGLLVKTKSSPYFLLFLGLCFVNFKVSSRPCIRKIKFKKPSSYFFFLYNFLNIIDSYIFRFQCKPIQVHSCISVLTIIILLVFLITDENHCILRGPSTSAASFFCLWQQII